MCKHRDDGRSAYRPRVPAAHKGRNIPRGAPLRLSAPSVGALTGVRPGKVLSSLIAEEHNEDKALRRFIREYDVSPARAQLCMTTTRETLRAAASLSPKDICLYVGIPFCPTRCAYCSFVSQSVEKSMKLIPPFLEALEKEILPATAAQVNALGLRVVFRLHGRRHTDDALRRAARPAVFGA